MLNPESIDLVLFDLDETIYDQRHCSLEGLKAVSKKFKEFHKDIHDLEKIYFNELHANHLKVIDQQLTEDQAHFNRFKTLAEYCKMPYNRNDILHMIEIYNDASQNNKRVIPGAIETIQYLLKANYKLGVITNGIGINQRKKIAFCQIEHLIEHILISEEVGYRKPQKKIFELALDHFSTPSQKAVMIGDSWDSDITGAINANIQPIWYNRRNNLNHRPNDVIEISNITDLKKIL